MWVVCMNEHRTHIALFYSQPPRQAKSKKSKIIRSQSTNPSRGLVNSTAITITLRLYTIGKRRLSLLLDVLSFSVYTIYLTYLTRCVIIVDVYINRKPCYLHYFFCLRRHSRNQDLLKIMGCHSNRPERLHTS